METDERHETFDVEGDERGCGKRQRGGIYIEAGRCTGPITKRCRPVWDFLVDPPIPSARLGIPNRGVMIRERPDGSGIFDVYDRVGEEFYPNAADFVEEVRRMGLSRRIGQNADFGKLTRDSVILLAHPRAILNNHEALKFALWDELGEYPNVPIKACPCGNQDHNRVALRQAMIPGSEMCVRLWYETIVRGEESFDPAKPPRTVERRMPSFAYEGRRAPEGFSPEWAEGIFMKYRIANLTVVKDAVAGTHAKAVDKASQSALPVHLEDA